MKSEGGNAKRDVLVCFALKEESLPFRKLLGGSAGIKILITGIGKRNTRRSFENALKNFTPSLVLTCGFAGALDPRFRVGDVVFLTIDPDLDKTLVDLGALPSSFLCSPRVAVTIAEKEKLRRDTGASAVEMESGVIHEICRERGIDRYATVRVISDTADENLPMDFNRLMTANQKISSVKLTAALLKSPGKIPELLKLQRKTKMAAQRLAIVLDGLLRAL